MKAAPSGIQNHRPAGVVIHPAVNAGHRPTSPAVIPEELRGRVLRAAELMRSARRRQPEPPFSTGLVALDEVLEGGVPCGSMIELVGSRSDGRMATVLSALAAMTDRGEIGALIDLGDHLDPRSAATAGVDLHRILWLRPRRLPEVLELTELLLQTGFPLVVADLGLPPVRGRVSAGAWMRVTRAARAHRAVVLLSSPYHTSGHTADAVVRMTGGRGRWSGLAQRLPLLEGLPFSCTVIRRRGNRPGTRSGQPLIAAEAAFSSYGSTPRGSRSARGTGPRNVQDSGLEIQSSDLDVLP